MRTAAPLQRQAQDRRDALQNPLNSGALAALIWNVMFAPRVTLSLSVSIALSGIAMPALAAEADEYRDEIRPVIQRKCYDCHGTEKQKGGLNLAEFPEYDAVIKQPEIWKAVLERVQAYEMPPESAPELTYGEQQKLMRWLRGLPAPPEPDCDKLASDRTQNFYRGYVMSRRLNRAEYQNTIRDLFGVQIPVADLLPADGGGGEGFDTSGNALFVSSIHIEKYLQAADRLAETLLPLSEAGLNPEIAAARQRILNVGADLSDEERARQIVSNVARRAFRRPVSDEETDRLMLMFDRGWQRGDGLIPSLRLALKAILVSPHFLFLAEPEPEEGGTQPLGSVPLASKLSYFIWSSMPDDELLALAESGRLLEPNVYIQQIHRLLADPKAQALGERFALQWLDLHRLGDEVRPDPKLFPEFDSRLSESMRHEAVAFFNYIFQNNRSLLELIATDYTFVDERLAKLYRLPNVTGPEMRRVHLPTSDRGGVVGMAAVHTLTSYPLRTSPVLRGRWVLETLLGGKVDPPPPDVPALEEEPEKIAHLTLREQLEVHRTKPDCAACHSRMDPLGFGLENFDVLGRWRDSDRGQPIDASGTLPSGETFTGPDGLKKLLMNRKDEVIRHLVQKMAGFAFGRELNKFDKCVIDRAMEALEANEYRAAILVEQLATSLPFRHRFYPKQELATDDKQEKEK